MHSFILLVNVQQFFISNKINEQLLDLYNAVG